MSGMKNPFKKPPKDTNSVKFRRYMAKTLDGRALQYVIERENDTDTVIGHHGCITVKNGVLSVVSFESPDPLFRAEVDTLSAWELMSLAGAVLTGYDLDRGRERTVIAYYTYYRK